MAPDGIIASGDASGEIRLWDSRDGRFLRVLARQGTWVGSLSFSPDGKHFAYVASQGDQAFVVVDGKEGPRFKTILNMDSTAVDTDLILFSPRCDRHAYIANTADEKKVVVVDGKASPVYDSVSPRPMFYADGEHFVYVATSAQGKAFVVTDGQAGPQFDSVTAWSSGWGNNTVGISPN